MSDSLAPSEPLPTNPNAGLTVAQRRMLAVFEIVLCSSVPTQLALGYVLTLGGWSPTTASGALSLPYVLTLSLADTLLLIVLMVCCCTRTASGRRRCGSGSGRCGARC